MARKVISSISKEKAISEEVSLSKTESLPFTDETPNSLDDISQAFLGFASNYSSLEEALTNISLFISSNYSGNNEVGFRDKIRLGYKTIVDELLESKRRDLELLLVKNI